MKINKTMVDLFAKITVSNDTKRTKTYPPHGEFEEKLDVPYLDDGEELHKYDVYYADKKNPNYKGVLIVDIHGGSYIFGSRRNNFYFGLTFLRNGFDFISIDYLPNNASRSVDSILGDVGACLHHIADHLEELGLGGDKTVLTGDSAGGHLALYMQEMSDDRTLAEANGFDLGRFVSHACLLNCPTYDYANLAAIGNMAKSGVLRMFGPKYYEEGHREQYSPRTHFGSLRSPLFVSTCSKDFIRMQSLMLFEDIKARADLMTKAIDLDDPSTGHVHNVIEPERPASMIVNEAMINFILDALKQEKE